MYLIAVSVLTELQKQLKNRYGKEEKCYRHLYHPEDKHCVHAYKVVMCSMLKLKNDRSNNSWQCLWDTLWRYLIIASRMLCFKILIWKKLSWPIECSIPCRFSEKEWRSNLLYSICLNWLLCCARFRWIEQFYRCRILSLMNGREAIELMFQQ